MHPLLPSTFLVNHAGVNSGYSDIGKHQIDDRPQLCSDILFVSDSIEVVFPEFKSLIDRNPSFMLLVEDRAKQFTGFYAAFGTIRRFGLELVGK